MEFLRGVLGFIGIGCAYMMGRSAGAVRQGWQKPSRLYGWIIRTFLCLAAITIRHALDAASIAIWTLSAVVFGVALWDASREKKREDVKLAIFPDDE